MTVTEKYCEDVIAGRIVTGNLLKKSVERHLNDLDASARGDLPYKFSQAHADHAINFIKKMKHTAGKLANKPFDIQPFQEFTNTVIFGWLGVHEDTGDVVRRFTKVYNEKARKGGKTEELAAIGNYLTYGEGEQGAQVFSAATKLDQARIVFKAARSMSVKFRRDNPVLTPHLLTVKDNISYALTESFFEPIPANSDKLDGLGPYGALIDEFHEHPDDALLKILETGMGSRTQPLIYIITTAGFNIYGPCYKTRSDNIKILTGINKDERSCCFIYNMDEGDDWRDQSKWIKPNPNLGKTPYMSYMLDQYHKAVNDGGTAEFQFRTKNLNEWMTSGATWIKDDQWMATSRERWNKAQIYERLKGRRCYVGMDLSTNLDLTVLVAIFPPIEGDDRLYVVPAFFCPEDNIPERSKSDKVNYDIWASDGYIKATPGRVVNYQYVFDQLAEWKQLFSIQRLDYDPSFAYQVIDEISRLGIKCETYGQNTRDMNPPIMEIERLVGKGQLEHFQHPIMRWNVSNVMLFTDSNGKRKFDKRKIVDRIDGCVALAMAMGGWLSVPAPRRSRYEDEDLFPINLAS